MDMIWTMLLLQIALKANVTVGFLLALTFKRNILLEIHSNNNKI